MDKEKQMEIWVGIVTCLGLCMLVFGILWGKGLSFFNNKQQVSILFHDVHGLETGDPVVVRGMEKGKVFSVHLLDSGVSVRIEVDADVTLYDDMTVVVQSKELMGGKQIAIQPGNSGVPADLSKLYTGTFSGDPIALFARAESLINQVEADLKQVNPALIQGELIALLAQLELTAKNTDVLIQQNKRAITETVRHMKTLAEQFEQDSTLTRLGLLIANLDSTSRKLNRLIVSANSGEGTIAALLQDSTLYENMKSTTASLDSLILDVKKNPKRYIHVSVF